MHDATENLTLQGADAPPSFMAVAWYYWPYLIAWLALHYVALFGLLRLYSLFSVAAVWFLLFMMSSQREEPRLKNMAGYARRRLTTRIGPAPRLLARGASRLGRVGRVGRVGRALIAPPLVVTVDGDVLMTPGGPRMALAVDLTSLDALDEAGKADLCNALARLALTRKRDQWAQFLLVSEAIDGRHVMADIRGLHTSAPATEDLATMRARDTENLAHEMRTRFVGTLTGYVVVGAPPRSGYADLDAISTLRYAAQTVQAQLTAMSLGSRLVSGDTLRALTTIPTIEAETPTYVRARGRYAATLALLEPDEATRPGYLVPLIEALACRYTLTIHLRGLDRLKEKKRFKRRRNVEGEDEEGNAGAGVSITRSRRRGVVQWGVYLRIEADTPDELRRHVAQAREIIAVDLNAELGRGVGHQTPLYLATLPLGHDTANRRWRIDTTTVGNCFPWVRFNPGTVGGFPIAFAGNQLVRLDPGDREHRNSIANVYGLTGSGKTVLGLKLLKWALYMGARGTVLERTGDPEKGIPSHYAGLCAVAGGDMVYLGGERTAALNMWDGSAAVIVGAHEILLGRPGEPYDPLHRSLLSQGVRAVLAAHSPQGGQGGQGGDEAPHEPPREAPLERHLHAWLVKQGASTHRPASERAILRTMAATLEPYVGTGEHAAIVDRATTPDLDRHLLVFNAQAAPDHLQPLLIYLINAAIARRGRREGEPAPITILDEGWHVAQFEAGAKAIKEWAKRGRHTAMYLIFLTQAVRDLKKNAGAVDLFESASINILMRLVSGTSDVVDDLAAAFDLTAAETETVRGLQTVRDEGTFTGHAEAFMIRQVRSQSKTIRHKISIPTNGDEAVMFLSDPLEMVWLRERLIAEHGSVWAGVTALRARLARGTIAEVEHEEPGEAGVEQTEPGRESELVRA